MFSLQEMRGKVVQYVCLYVEVGSCQMYLMVLWSVFRVKWIKVEKFMSNGDSPCQCNFGKDLRLIVSGNAKYIT